MRVFIKILSNSVDYKFFKVQNIDMFSWKQFFDEVKQKDYSSSLKTFLDEEYSKETIYPPRKDMFKAFELTPKEEVKVVIIGQDPYHEPGQAMGLSFSVPAGTRLPPSLVNIYKEIENDIGIRMKNNGDLTYLAKQGVLLINAYLTVRRSAPLSHHRDEYDLFMKDLMIYLDNLEQPIVFMLWGNFAKKYEKYLQNPDHLILKSVHPSPLGANHGGWFNLHQFSKTNEFLLAHNVKPIDWQN